MSDLVQLRKIAMHFEEIYHDGGPPQARPLVRAAILAVVENPYAGRFVDNLDPFMEALGPTALDMARRLVDALGSEPEVIEAYGEGAIVGANGEFEHGALWHEPASRAMAEVLADARAVIPSAKKVGPVGTRLDVPIGHIRASAVRSHFDGLEVGIADAPRDDELIFVLVMTTGGRIHARTGGLSADQIEGRDGVR